MRELRPALTPAEIKEADQVYRHAIETDARLQSNKPVRVVVRCNQLGPAHEACDWTVRLESRASRATSDARTALHLHLSAAHPYLLDEAGIQRVMGATWYNLRDIGG